MERSLAVKPSSGQPGRVALPWAGGRQLHGSRDWMVTTAVTAISRHAHFLSHAS